MNSPLVAQRTINDYVEVREVADGKSAADQIMQRRYGRQAPECPIHVIAFSRTSSGLGPALGYIHFTEMGDALLAGGACVDDRELRHLSEEARNAIRRGGGVYRHTLEWCMQHFADRYQVLFGYSGDSLAQRGAIAAGFQKTAHRYLLARFLTDMDADARRRMVARVHAVGPF